jgi:hypothetical protein
MVGSVKSSVLFRVSVAKDIYIEILIGACRVRLTRTQVINTKQEVS